MIAADLNETLQINHATLRRLRFIENRYMPLLPILRSFGRVIESLREINRELMRRNGTNTPQSPEGTFQNFEAISGNHAQYLMGLLGNMEHLLQSTRAVAQLVSDTLSFKDSQHTLMLTQSTVDDSVTVQVVTVATLLFISFTSVAVSETTPSSVLVGLLIT